MSRKNFYYPKWSTNTSEYYQSDLIGFDVIRGETKIGVVDCFQNFGGGDIIELDNGEMVSFKNADELKEHFIKHGRECNCKTPKEYLKAANKIIKSKEDLKQGDLIKC